MLKSSRSVLLLLACVASAGIAVAQSDRLNRLIIGTNVVCRDEPGVSSAPAGVFGLGDQLVTSDVREADGQAWYLVQSKAALTPEFDYSSTPSNCWVIGSLTTPYELSDPEPALIALADHALTSDEAGFQDLVAVENVLNAESVSEVIDSSARLQVRRLQVINLALQRPWSLREPLAQSWIESHGDLLRYWSIGRTWYIPADEFWRLYESFEGVPGSEEIAWAAATAAQFFDECFTYCRLNLIARTRMQYWTRFPAGLYIDEAMSFAIDQTERAGRYCILGTTGILRMDFRPIQDLIVELRDSLNTVSAGGKDEILVLLAEIEESCLTNQVSDLDDPQAIPGLVRALGSGFSIVPRQLAGFGEQALPAILEVMRTREQNSDLAADGLRALRYMLELQGNSRLSGDALEEIRAVTEQWLTRPGQSILTLGHAIDLAVLLDDSDLIEIVELLATSRDEVFKRVAQEEAAVRFVQGRAAARLAGAPPLPRP